MKPLLALIDELESRMSFSERKKESISQASVGWHIEHSLLAMIKMMSSVEHSNPAEYKWTFNLKRLIILTTGKIPRGRAKAPASVVPAAQISKEAMHELIEKAKQKAKVFEKSDRHKFFTHPYFGDLRFKQARRTIAIHTKHHLEIIQDIIK